VSARWLAVLGGLAGLVGAAVPAAAFAASPSGAVVSFSGALSGHLTTPSTDCSNVTATSGEIDFSHSLKGHGGSSWSLFFTAPHSGTWKGVGLTASSSFNLQSAAGTSVSWTGKSGSFTTKGTSGSVNMVLKPQIGSSGHGLVHVKGSWDCP
jgi:hypothetical protein